MAERTKVRRALAAAAGAATLVAASMVVALGADGSVSITEADEVYSFGPGGVTVTVGEKVTWSNDSDAPHTVTSDGSGPMDSPEFGESETFEATFDTAGDFAYHCEIHDYMTGVVHVASDSGGPPPTDVETQPGTGAGPGGPAMLPFLLALAGLLGAAAISLRLRLARRA